MTPHDPTLEREREHCEARFAKSRTWRDRIRLQDAVTACLDETARLRATQGNALKAEAA